MKTTTKKCSLALFTLLLFPPFLCAYQLTDYTGNCISYICAQKGHQCGRVTRLTWTCQCGRVYAHGQSCTDPDCPSNR